MEKNRRKDKRYRTNWKVAMVFGASEKRPIFHTLTHDLSVNGTAIQYSTDEKVNTVLTLLLIPPAIDGIDQKVIKLKAVVMSSRAFRNDFRLGFSFVHDAELEKLWGTLKRLDLSGDTLPSVPQVAATPGNAPAAPQPAAAPASTAPAAPAPAHPLSQTSVLELIKQRNLDKKKADEQAVVDKEEEQRQTRLVRMQAVSLRQGGTRGAARGGRILKPAAARTGRWLAVTRPGQAHTGYALRLMRGVHVRAIA